jgi:RNA polymerase sigma-70 factor (ECF subfamily)
MDGKRSFQEIYERFQPGVLRFLSRLVGEEEAEDVAQEVFLRVDRGLEGFRGESSIGTWIYRIARNAALDRLRSRPAWLENASRLRTHGSEDDPTDIISQLPDERASLERYLIGKEMSECIRGRVDTLPESYRRVLVLSELVGRTNAEIASALGVSEGAVKIRLHRARSLLREDLGTHCTLYHDELDELACEPKSASGSI